MIGLTALAIIGMLMTARRLEEERFLIERFGDSCREYRDKTGSFIPRSKKRRRLSF